MQFRVEILRIDYFEGNIRPQIGVKSLISDAHSTPPQFPERTVGTTHDYEVFKFVGVTHTTWLARGTVVRPFYWGLSIYNRFGSIAFESRKIEGG